jgi:hypothetical protein
MKHVGRCGALVLGLAVLAGPALSAELPFKIKKERPRIFVQTTDWQGPTPAKLKKWAKLPEYQKRGGYGKMPFMYLATGDAKLGKKAVAALMKSKIGGSSPSYSGRRAAQYAAQYDWLRNCPDFTPEQRQKCIAHMEQWGDSFKKFVNGRMAFFYSRFPGAICGLATIGLALHGDSPKAEGYVKDAHKFFLEYGRARAWEGGGSAGGTYSIYHAFPDLGRTAAAFETATDFGMLKYIREKQDNWLEKQLLWQIWYTYPDGLFLKEGDCWKTRDKTQFRLNIDILTGILGNGYGRTHANAMYKRWGRDDYHQHYVLDFFVFNNPDVKPKPLSELGRAALFGRESHGYVFFRSGWTKKDTMVFFKCGEGLDVHCYSGTGSFIIWRGQPLADRAGGAYTNGKGGNALDENAMVFIGGGHNGKQRRTAMKENVSIDFKSFLARKKRRGVEAGSITDYQVTDKFARVKGDLSAAVRKNCEMWTRELVFLDYKYLLVLDQVKTKAGNVKKQWHLNLQGQASADGKLARTDRGNSRLFCRTLLPEKAQVTLGKGGKSGQRLIVADPDDAKQAATFLHVLMATDSGVAAMPKTACTREGDKLTVTVGSSSYTFGAAK